MCYMNASSDVDSTDEVMWFRLHYRVCSTEDCSCRCEEVSFVCVCVFQLVPQWSPPCLCCLPLLCRSLETQPHCSACSALTLQRGRRWAGRWTGQRSPRGFRPAQRASGTDATQQRPESQQSTLGRRKELRLQSNTWRSSSRAAVPQELRVLMFLQWRAAGFTAVTWFTAQYSSSLSICCHCCSFNKASERLTFVFDCIIDQCVLPSLKFQLLMDCNSWEQLRLAVNVNWSSWGLNMVSGTELLYSETIRITKAVNANLISPPTHSFTVWSVQRLNWNSFTSDHGVMRQLWGLSHSFMKGHSFVKVYEGYIIVQFTKQTKRTTTPGTEKIVFFCFSI